MNNGNGGSSSSQQQAAGGNNAEQGQRPGNTEEVKEAVVLSPPTSEQLNMRCAGVKRLLKEAMELRQPNELFCAKPMEDNLFEWHFSVRGPPDTVYAEGVYHGRIVLPADYPMKPPNLILLTPNGRFETNKKICLSISGYHPETWLPSWSIRTALLALVGFMPTHSAGALGGLECSQEERHRLALKSLDWSCPQCGVKMCEALPPLGSTGKTERLMAEVKSASGSTPTVVAAVKATKVESSSGKDDVPSAQQQLTADGQGGVANVQTVTSNQVPPTNPAAEIASPSSPPTSSTSGQSTSMASNRMTSTAATSSRLNYNWGPPLWIFVLSALFLALLMRRLLLNHAATGSRGNGAQFQ